MNPEDPPVEQTHQVRAKLREREIQKDALESDSRRMSNITLNQLVRVRKIEEFFYGKLCISIRKWRNIKSGFQTATAGYHYRAICAKMLPVVLSG